MSANEQKLITDKEILELSMKMEREGQLFYDSLSKQVEDPAIKSFLQTMHKEEIQHEKLFKAMLEKKEGQPYGWEDKKELHDFIDEHFKTDIFPRLEDVIDETCILESLNKAVDFAVEAEMISAEFYSLLGDYCDNLEAKTSLLLLEQAENDHIKQVLAIKEKLHKEE